MKYLVISDLHIDFYSNAAIQELIAHINSAQADHILLAGDICNGTNLLYRDYLLDGLRLPCTWVMGNHDYYGRQLESDTGISGDVTYASLWTNFWDGNPHYKNIAQRSVSDFAQIETPNGLVLPDELEELFHAHWKFLQDNPNPIIMTHFPMSIRSIHERYLGDPTNPYFVNDLLDSQITALGAKLIVHGHVHSSFDYNIGSARILCNPLGYPDENYTDVTDYPLMIVDI